VLTAARVAALYDVHGNLPALEAVLEEVAAAAPDLVVVGGDAVLGPMPSETLELLRGLDCRTAWIRGNADREMAERHGEAEGLPPEWAEITRWCADRLGEDGLTFIGGLPETATVHVAGLGPVLFCHGSPRSDAEIITPASEEDRLRAALAGVSERLVVCGHTHMQFELRVGGARIVNAGSVGMAYAKPGAYWLLLDDDVRFRRTAYDRDEAARRIRGTSFPALDFASLYVLDPPTTAEAIETFETQARQRPET
jgi:predicted phosphodiesterase